MPNPMFLTNDLAGHDGGAHARCKLDGFDLVVVLGGEHGAEGSADVDHLEIVGGLRLGEHRLPLVGKLADGLVLGQAADLGALCIDAADEVVPDGAVGGVVLGALEDVNVEAGGDLLERLEVNGLGGACDEGDGALCEEDDGGGELVAEQPGVKGGGLGVDEVVVLATHDDEKRVDVGEGLGVGGALLPHREKLGHAALKGIGIDLNLIRHGGRRGTLMGRGGASNGDAEESAGVLLLQYSRWVEKEEAACAERCDFRRNSAAEPHSALESVSHFTRSSRSQRVSISRLPILGEEVAVMSGHRDGMDCRDAPPISSESFASRLSPNCAACGEHC
ncbi:hypothetical protein L1887_48980 [Cichorium endivia]|nr:hypothetical protein L1887_48980 [Cichorium endivia]